MKVKMVPHLHDVQRQEPSGIRTVVEKYFRHLPDYGVELVAPDAMSYDLLAVHAGSLERVPANQPLVLHCHGLYWTDDQPGDKWQFEANRNVINLARQAQVITVPSHWVAETFRRDMHLQPWVVPHGVDFAEWMGGEDQGYVLWNKNRTSDVCDPAAVALLAQRFPQREFVTTFFEGEVPANVTVIGQVPHHEMQQWVKHASVYLATVKETFGIATLEALAAGVPVLGWDFGGTADLVAHGRTGYLALPGDEADLARGLEWITMRRPRLSRAAMDVGRHSGWEYACELVAHAYASALQRVQAPPQVAVIIPCYNKAETVERAVRSVAAQTLAAQRVIVVNNNSTDGFEQVQGDLVRLGCEVVNCAAQGVAHARNEGIGLATDCQYICCLDADDEIAPTFLATCVAALEADHALGIAYTGLTGVKADGSRFLSAWPGHFDYENFTVGHNQVPTCCVFRRELWQRAGGYRQRYAPRGAGAEDAEFFLRLGSLGGKGAKVSDEGLFIYHLGGTVSGDPHYQEPDWRAGKPWLQDGRHPFASIAQPANGLSHRVRQYDEPLVSIVVPVGPGHISHLVDCLDSIEAQSNRQWECIVVGDVAAEEQAALQWRLDHGYAWARLLTTTAGPLGAGAARNLGAKMARAPLLLFLDADDWLTPDALNLLLGAYAEDPFTIVYGQYIGHAYISEERELTRLRGEKRLLAYDSASQEAAILYDGGDFDCEKAMAQPDMRKPYIWNVITSLLPKQYHEEIGGFDEQMRSWEDWDYWLRLARSNHCFTRVAAPVMEYRFYTGGRRALANPTESGESGRQLSSSLLEYMQDKYRKEGDVPGCRSCGGRKKPTPMSVAPVPMMALTIDNGGMARMSGDDFVMVQLNDGNVGNHRIVFQRTDYGYRSHGDQFMMKRSHATQDRRVIVVESVKQPSAQKSTAQRMAVPAAAAKPLPADDLLTPEAGTLDEASKVVNDKSSTATVQASEPVAPAASEERTYQPKAPYDFTLLDGIGEERAKMLVAKGFRSLQTLIGLDVTGIQQTLGVPQSVAEKILQSAKHEAAQ